MFVRVLVVCSLFGGAARALAPKYPKIGRTTDKSKLMVSTSTEPSSTLFLLGNNVTKPATVKKPTNYCDPDLCYPGVKHIGCNNRNTFSSANCQAEAQTVPMTQKRRDWLVHIHNKFRSKVASGHLKGFAPAENMPQLVWDSELAHLAELNVKTCVYHHDQCHNTFKYPKSGQNIAMYMDSQGYGDVDKVAAYSIKMMFNEYKYANMNHIVSYSEPESGQDIGHFTLMVNDKVTHVGCAISKFMSVDSDTAKLFKTTYLVCNYSYANVDGDSAYICGAPCIKCPKACSEKYSGLCEVNKPKSVRINSKL